MAHEQRDRPERRQGGENPEAETFKREGPPPPENSTGGSVEELNRAAEDSLVRNIRPDDSTD